VSAKPTRNLYWASLATAHKAEVSDLLSKLKTTKKIFILIFARRKLLPICRIKTT